VVRELFAEGSALLFAKRSQVWVLHLLILDGEVMEALGVADKVDCWRHDDKDDVSKRWIDTGERYLQISVRLVIRVMSNEKLIERISTQLF
jgi:hypothetical protein